MADSPQTAHGNGNGWTSLRAWANAIAQVGIPGALAIFLVYVGATKVPQIVELQLVIIQKQDQAAAREMEKVERDNRLERLLQRVCSNTARDENARQRCFDK